MKLNEYKDEGDDDDEFKELENSVRSESFLKLKQQNIKWSDDSHKYSSIPQYNGFICPSIVILVNPQRVY